MIFKAEQFTPTSHTTAQQKAQFANQLLKFIDSGYKRALFTSQLYNRLNSCFGHIAHYNIHGFYEEWFTTPEDQQRFIENLLRYPCYGSPAFTFSDVERALQQHLLEQRVAA